ncbi:hypothetical protein [Sphingomonas aracearum]|uniref:Uncharacterized protein n=1 Tax=Sphingomonas aracearum TaxID=2283317 RepID=A0A369VYF0_9SPHN|nr:hypothetical protein [Sphingomonas aracearum]RDE07163.1 hypothetical protein DVW87_05840 [Sphingomonas aracearum]
MADAPGFPDGIGDDHAARDPVLRRHASIVSLLVFGGLLLAALLGTFGGGRSPVRTAQAAAATLTVATPRTLRNGVFFETRVTVTARRDIARLVLALPPSLWRDITVNSQVPQASEEKFENGRFAFDYGPLKAGESLDVKIDGQINPPLFGGTSGTIAVLDDKAELVSLPVTMKVLP